jgi:signal transduction histidine kinase
MKLRIQLVISAGMAMLPVMLALLRYDALMHQRAAQQLLVSFITAGMGAARERCEAAPEFFGGVLPPDFSWGRPPPLLPLPGQKQRALPVPPIAFAYGPDFSSRNPQAPALSPELIRMIAGRDLAIAPLGWRSSTVEVLLRMPWDMGPCAYVLARGPTVPEWGAVLPETELWLLPIGAVLVAVLLAVGRIVRRIQQLTKAVQRSASSAYESPVELVGRDELSDLARAFDAAAIKIRAQLQEKDRREQALRDFLANTTHDVMIPLTVLLGHLTALRECAKAPRPLDPEALKSAMDEAHYIASLVHNLALVARLEAAELKLQVSTVDLNALIQRIVGRHRPVARAREISLENGVPPEPLILAADLTLLEQAVSNITYNAIHYNRAGGHVAVIAELKAPDRFVLRVIDDGPGIPAAELSRLVARGTRGDAARTRAPEGQGLGLHIAYRAAELHGFELTLKPSEYGGLEVMLEGPCGPSIT